MTNDKKRVLDRVKAPDNNNAVTVFLSIDDINTLVSILSFAATCLDTIAAESATAQDQKALEIYISKRGNCQRLKDYLTDIAVSGEPDSRELH
jgi:hypothetical protein